MLLLRWLTWWPLGLVHALGAGLGWLVWLLSPGYRHRLGANASLAGLSASQRRAAVSHAGRLSLEVPWLWFRSSRRPLAGLIEWRNAELVEQALDAGKGLLLITPHLGNFEMSGRAYAERFGARQPLTAMYRPARQPWLARLQLTARDHEHMRAVPATVGGVRQLLRTLRQGGTLAILPDQVPPEGQGVWVPFFGRPAYTMTLVNRLVHQTGCTPLLMLCERLPGSQGYRLSYFALPEPLPVDGDETLSAERMNRAMEWLIRQVPEQYLWAYNRYKGPRAAAAPLGTSSEKPAP